MRKIFLTAALFSCIATAIGQIGSRVIYRPDPGQAGKTYVFWGWNRDVYSQSNIHFWGDGYDFTLIDVNARDAQSKFGFSPYFNPLLVTLPQTNARIGHYVSKKLSLSLGLDHMKYVMNQIQAVPIEGHISGTGTVYDADYAHQVIYTRREFVTFEHTDGLNYINVEARSHTPWFRWRPKRWMDLYMESFAGAGAGILLPKTNARLFNGRRHDDFHLSGYGAHLLAGVSLTLWDHFMIQPEFKGGYINMPDIRTSHQKDDRAAQKFWFGEFAIMVGGSFRLGFLQRSPLNQI